MSDILVVGSAAYDSIRTPKGSVEGVLGGSANYFSLVASLYSQVHVVGVVGDDYQDEDLSLLKNRNVDVAGLQKVPGKTFHWKGQYENDMNEAITLETHLNVFENFHPKLPDSYKEAKYIFLANIDPVLQLEVLEQVHKPKFVGADTMNFWIDSKIDDLKALLKKIDVLLLNEGEAQKLTGNFNTIAAMKELSAMGPKGVVVKRGEYGFVLFAENQFFILPAFPVENVVDPTGAGDSFAGGFFGYLARLNEGWSLAHLKQACIHGCLMASFTVENFGVRALTDLNWSQFEERQAEYFKVITYLN